MYSTVLTCLVVFLFIFRSSVHAASCPSTNIPLGSYFMGVSVYSSNITYLSLTSPVASPNIAAATASIGAYYMNTTQCGRNTSINLFVGNGFCPNETTHDSAFLNISAKDIDLPLSSVPTNFTLGIQLIQTGNCTRGLVSVLYGVSCPSTCPTHSYCDTSKNGCTCLTGYYGIACNISGQCDPFGPVQYCGIDGGIGLGNQTCQFTNAEHNQTTWGTCNLMECLPGYDIKGNNCIKATNKTTDSDIKLSPLKFGLILGGTAIGAALFSGIVTAVILRRRSHYSQLN